MAVPQNEISLLPGCRDDIGLTGRDVTTFGRRLTQLYDACSREDLPALRRVTTPEVFGKLSAELAANEARGMRNVVVSVKLISGDIAEAWREGPSDYATVALHYESCDIMVDRMTGSPDPTSDGIAEKREVWTFVRHNGSDWLLRAIQN